PGVGKSTLLLWLLQRFHETAITSFVFNTLLNASGLIRSVLLDMGVDASGDDLGKARQKLQELIQRQSTQRRANIIVFIDEAHNLDVDAFNYLGMLFRSEEPTRGKI